MTRSGTDGWRRRLPFYLLVCGMAVLVAQYFHRQPVELQVVYHYDASGGGLQTASFEYHGAAEVLAQARFSYRDQPSDQTQTHQVKLPRGEYTVSIELRYDASATAQRAARRLQLARPPVGEVTLTVSRRLTVHDAGEAHIYL